MVEQGLWSETMKNRIIAHGGSIQNVPGIPDDIKRLYKTVWEISQKAIIDMAADRGAFICQSQSLNIHLSAPTFGQLTSMHFYGWKKGLKTGTYYLRTRPAANAIQFTISQEEQVAAKAAKKKAAITPAPQQSEQARAFIKASEGGEIEKVTRSVGKMGIDASITRDGPGDKVLATQDSGASSPTSTVVNESEQTESTPSVDPKEDEGYKRALARQRERELADAKLQCSLENKEACLMCSG